MRRSKLFILIALSFILIPLTSAESIDFSCPESVPVNEEFTCTIEILEGEGAYDVKLNVVDSDSKSVIRVLHGETWKSGFYYIKEFVGINELKEINVKGEVSGTYESVVKIRKGSFQESFPFTISFGEEEVLEEPESEEDEEPQEAESEEETIETKEETIAQEKDIFQSQKEKVPQVISLNQPQEGSDDEITNTKENTYEVVYESKNSKILRAAPYAFSIFLLIIIGFLLWERL